MEIRELGTGDKHGLSELILGLYDTDRKALWFSGKPSRAELGALFDAKMHMVKALSAIDIVAMDGERLVGECEIVKMRDAQAKIGILVGAQWQDQGIGGTLLRHSLEKARELGINEVLAEVEIGNFKATNFFSKHGFALDAKKARRALVDNVFRNIVTFIIKLD